MLSLGRFKKLPIHNFLCLKCGAEEKDIYISLDDFDHRHQICGCGEEMSHDLRRTPTNTRGIRFPAFHALHMRRLEGEVPEITSLAQVRALEKKHEKEELCFEAFSYTNDQYGADSSDGRPEKEPLRHDPNREIPQEFLIDSEIE